jgi:DNA-binding transcriptional LysR family regulator
MNRVTKATLLTKTRSRADTHVGEELLVFVRRMLQMRKEVIDLLRAMHQPDLKPFRLGFSPFAARHIVDTVYETYLDRVLFAASRSQTLDQASRDHAKQMTIRIHLPDISAW